MITILNDVHLGAKRKSGTTPQSQQDLGDYLLSAFSLQVQSVKGELVIAGDLFDSFEVDSSTLLQAYLILEKHLASRKGLVLIAGNHDWSPRGDKLSSFHLLANLLIATYPNSLLLIDDGFSAVDTDSGVDAYAIPHMPNQDVFDLELEKALNYDEGYIKNLILHANYDNGFCDNSDHSLNVSREIAKRFVDKGIRLIFAHEHQAKESFGGKVLVMGNQIPSSVADCLGNDAKHMHVLHDDGLVEIVQTWSRGDSEGYSEIDWRELKLNPSADKGFIRVTGSAEAAEAEAVVDAISKYRAKSTSFVVTNAVKIAGMAEMNAMGEVAAESIKTFDVLTALLEELDDRERKVVKEMLE